MVRRKTGGGATTETLVEIDIDAETSARGDSSLVVTLGLPSRTPASGEKTGLHPATIGNSFYDIDDFDDYDDTSDLTVFGNWDYGLTSVGKTFTPAINITNYNVVSFYAKTEYPVSVYFSVKGSNNIWTRNFPVYINSRFWKRYDALVAPTQSVPNPSYRFNYSMSEINFEFRGAANTKVWIDELFLLDLRTASDKSTWISMNVGEEEVSHQSEMVIAEAAGRRGDIVYGTYASNKRGSIQFRTHAPQDEMDLFFVESQKGNGNLCYLRNVGEGWPVYIDNISVNIRDTYFGSQRDIDMTFVEDTLG